MYIKQMNRLRGIGILLVVIGHSIFIDMVGSDNGSSAEFYSYIYKVIYSFHMPLFFFISGFFALKLLKISNIKEYVSFVKNKFLKLMIPYLVLSVIAIVIKTVLSNYSMNKVDISYVGKTVLLFPWESPMRSLWYIYTLFVVFALAPLLNRVPGKIKVLCLIVLYFLPQEPSGIFNLSGALRNMSFLYLGMYFNKFYDSFLFYRRKGLVVLLAVITLILVNLFNFHFGYLDIVYKFFVAIIGIVFGLCLAYIIRNDFINMLLDGLGKYSYDIYLLSWFPQMAVRVLYQKFNFNYNILVLLSLFSAFLVIPISKYIIRRNAMLKILFIGGYEQRTKKLTGMG